MGLSQEISRKINPCFQAGCLAVDACYRQIQRTPVTQKPGFPQDTGVFGLGDTAFFNCDSYVVANTSAKGAN
jgi:hypothetical protein